MFLVKMSVDIRDLQFKHPFTAMVAGPTGSGKTVLVRRILNQFKHLISGVPDKIKVIWAYGAWQDLYSVKLNNVEIIYLEGLPSEQEINEIQPHIVVLDDLMNELANNKKLGNLFTKGSHHKGLSIFFIVQNVFHQGSQMRTVSLNCHYLLLLKNPRDRQQIMTLARQINPTNPKHFIESFDDATNKPYGYIKVDLKPDTPERLRLRTRITLEEHSPFSPIVYLPK